MVEGNVHPEVVQVLQHAVADSGEGSHSQWAAAEWNILADHEGHISLCMRVEDVLVIEIVGDIVLVVSYVAVAHVG